VPDAPDARPGNATLVMNYFGLRQAFAVPRRGGVEIVEDHSHGPSFPLATSSAADFCIASLRKTISLSDGGVLWSPVGHALPPEPHLTMQRKRAAATKLSAMILKGMYLESHRIDKASFRDLAERGERGLTVPGVSSMSDVARAILGSFPLAAWRSARAANHVVLTSRLAQVGWARVLAPADGDSVPFSCVVVVDSAELRERARRHLIAAN
jgi:hypothetical protein